MSLIGRKDIKDQEQMFENIMKNVRLNPLNKKLAPLGYNEYIRPLLIGKL